MTFNIDAAVEDLLKFSRNNGINLSFSDIQKRADSGEWIRCNLIGQEKKKNVSVRVWLGNGVPNADFHVYGRAQGHMKWIYKPNDNEKTTQTERPKFELINAERTKAESEETKKRQELAARGAAAIWKEASAKGTAPMHGYLTRKGLPATSAYALKGAEVVAAWQSVTNDTKPMYGDDVLELIIPLTDAEEKIWNVQRIRDSHFPGVSTNKMLLRGGQKKGLFNEVRAPTDTFAPVIIAEGWATAVSIALCVEPPVGVYMGIDKDNLLPAAKEIQRLLGLRHPIIFAGDNDCQTEGNPGKTAAMNAAEAIGGIAIIPYSIGGKATDWNDVMLNKKADVQEYLSEKAINAALWEKSVKR